MERIIKFRAWEIDTKTMLDNTRFSIYNDSKTGEVFAVSNFGDCVLKEYIGMKDSKGNDIYEGDIIKCTKANGFISTCIGVIKKSAMAFMVEGKNGYGDKWLHTITNETITVFPCKIIGNIHENPELLK